VKNKPDRAALNGGETVFFGKIVWYDDCRTSAGTFCLCGIAFETLHERERAMLTALLRRLEGEAKAESKPTASQ